MALYQPSNITPSSFAGLGGGVVDVNDNIYLSWQVNGNSGMTAARIKIYENDAASTWVCTLDIAQNPAFYGTDETGNVKFYVFNPNYTWASQSLSNGNAYKMTIDLSWHEGGTQKWVYQSSPSLFITRSKPTLSVSPAAGTLTSVTQNFTATYGQTEGDSIANVRWVLSDEDGNILDDTGTIYTGDLKYTYNGFFSGESYSLSCTVETESGVTVTATNAYTVSYSSASASGGISLSCNPDDSVSLSWMAGADIPGDPSAVDYGSIVNGVLHLDSSRNIIWNEVNESPMSFTAPYALAWRGVIGEQAISQQTISSGTWEKYKDTSATGNSTVSKTVSSLTLTKPYNNNTSETVTSDTLTSVSYTYESGSESATGSYYDGHYEVTIYPQNSYYDIVDITNVVTSSNVTSYEINHYDNGTAGITLRGTSAVMSYTAQYKLKRYTGTKTFTPSHSNVTTYSVSSTTASAATIAPSGSSYIVTFYARSSGVYSATIAYTYQTAGNDSYSGSVTDTFPASSGTLTNVTILSTTGTGGATVTRSGNTYTVTIKNNTSSSCTASVQLTYTYQVAGPQSYRCVLNGTLDGAVSGTIVSANPGNLDTISVNNGTYTVTMYNSTASSKTVTVDFIVENIPPHVTLIVLNPGTANVVNIRNTSTQIIMSSSGLSENAVLPIFRHAHEAMIYVTPTLFGVLYFDYRGNELARYATSISFTPPVIESVGLYGAQECSYSYITSDTAYDFIGHVDTPVWSADTLFNASFDNGLQAGTAEEDLSVALYRRSGSVLTPLGVYGPTVNSVRDYGIRSQHIYEYILYYISNNVYSAAMTSDENCRQFRQFTLIEAQQDANDQSIYHPVSVWRFRNNIEAGAVSNGNTPALLDNFTKYPYWQPSSPAAKSGTLTALLSFFSDGEYIRETAEDMERLYALSQSVNPLFLRDLKGNLYMVRLSGPISQTVNYKTGVMEVTVSVPWIEVGDADDAKILAIGG